MEASLNETTEQRHNNKSFNLCLAEEMEGDKGMLDQEREHLDENVDGVGRYFAGSARRSVRTAPNH